MGKPASVPLAGDRGVAPTLGSAAWIANPLVLVSACAFDTNGTRTTLAEAGSGFTLRIRGQQQRMSGARLLQFLLDQDRGAGAEIPCYSYSGVVAHVNGVEFPASQSCALSLTVLEQDAQWLFDESVEDLVVEFQDRTGIIRVALKNPVISPSVTWLPPSTGMVHVSDQAVLRVFPVSTDLSAISTVTDGATSIVVPADTISNPDLDRFAVTVPSGLATGAIQFLLYHSSPDWHYPVSECAGVAACSVDYVITDDIPVANINVAGVLVP